MTKTRRCEESRTREDDETSGDIFGASVYKKFSTRLH